MTQNSVETPYAGFWRRLSAGVVDFGLWLPLTYVGAVIETLSPAASIATAVLTQMLYYVYVVPVTKRYGGTLGKLAVGIRVRPLDGGALTWRHVWLRSIVDLASSILIVAGTIVGHATVDFNAYRVASWGDRATLLQSAVPWYEWASNAYLAWLMSEFVVVLLNSRRRALHDFIAGTVVIVSRGQRASASESPLSAPVM
ncbi:MAG: RDD family protein [Gemmatimonadota bacterium]